jgi:hypothetical protein
MTMHGDKPIFSQSQEGATLEAYDPTFREKTEAVIRDLLTQYGGLSSGGARNIAQGFTGTTDPSQGIMESLGVLDFTPAGLLFGGQEAKRDFDKAQSGLDYIAPTVGLVFTGAEAFPLTKVMTKPARTFLSNLSRKSPEIEEPLITSAGDKPKDPSRRKFIQGAASVPIAAGALSNIPVGKIIDDIAPVAKKIGKVLPKDAFNIPIFNQAMNKELADKILSGKMGARLKKIGESDIDEAIMEIDTDQELKVMRDSYDWFRSGKKGDPPNDFAKLMDEEYSNAGSDEIANLIGDSNQAGGDVWQETQLFKNPDKKEIAKAVRDKTYNWDLLEANKPDGFDQLNPKQQDLIFSMGINEAPKSWIAENTASLLESGVTSYGKKVK